MRRSTFTRFFAEKVKYGTVGEFREIGKFIVRVIV
jgi:hypothetical protein